MGWAEREAKILEAILAIEEADRDRVMTDELATTTGLNEVEVRRGLEALIEDGFMSAKHLGGSRGPLVLIMPRLRGKGRRAVGQWPKDGFDALVAILDERIRAVPEGPEKNGLERFRDAILGMTRDVVIDVLGAAIKSAGGI